nr:thioredoxin family protein [Halorussus halophilus]
MTPRKASTLAFFALLLGIGYLSMHAAPVLSDEKYSYHGDTKWRTDFSQAEQVAEQKDKPIVVYFWTTWCTYCEDYNRNVYSDPAVQSSLDDFVLVAVNLDSDAREPSRLKQKYNVNYPPQHVIITPDGEVLTRISGYAPKQDFLAYLERAKQKSNGANTTNGGGTK